MGPTVADVKGLMGILLNVKKLDRLHEVSQPHTESQRIRELNQWGKL